MHEALVWLKVMNTTASSRLSCTATGARWEANSLGLDEKACSEREVSSVSLVMFAELVVSTSITLPHPSYRESDLADRDQLHPCHRKPSRPQSRGGHTQMKGIIKW